MAFPTMDKDLVPYSTNFNTRIVAAPGLFDLVVGQCTQYTTLHDAYLAAYAAISVQGAKSGALVNVKDTAKAALLAYGRSLYGIVQSSSNVTDANKILLGVTVRARPTSNPTPSVTPAVDIMSVVGHMVSVRVHDAAGEGKRRKPPMVQGCAIYSYVGATAPTDPTLYKYEGSTNRSLFNVAFPDSVAPGATVWLTAMWYNRKAQTGPACTPISAVIQYGMTQAQPMKIAA